MEIAIAEDGNRFIYMRFIPYAADQAASAFLIEKAIRAGAGLTV